MLNDSRPFEPLDSCDAECAPSKTAKNYSKLLFSSDKVKGFFFFFPSFNFKVTVSLGRTEQNHFLSLDVTLASKQKQKTNDSRAYLEVQARRLMWNWSFLSSVKRKRYAANGRAMHLFFLILLLLFFFFPQTGARCGAERTLGYTNRPVRCLRERLQCWLRCE